MPRSGGHRISRVTASWRLGRGSRGITPPLDKVPGPAATCWYAELAERRGSDATGAILGAIVLAVGAALLAALPALNARPARALMAL